MKASKRKNPTGRPRSGGGIPFESKLEPYFDFIKTERLKRKSWAQIAGLLQVNFEITITPQGIFRFIKARAKRRHAFGMVESDYQPSADAPKPASSPPQPTPPVPGQEAFRAQQNAAIEALRAKAKALSNQAPKPAWDLHVDDDKPLKG